jgi:uncharacterized protein YndB with AHSA1/START domain
MTSTRLTRHLNAPRAKVYEALLDPAAVVRWKVPTEMTSTVHEFDAREGGMLRISLTYTASDRTGKSAENTDTYRGRFIQLIPNELVVEVDEFETSDPAFAGPMTITIMLSESTDGGTDLVATHEGLPEGVAPADNELGWQQSLDRLADLVEATPPR